MEHRNMNLTLTSRNINHGKEYVRTESVSEVNAVKKRRVKCESSSLRSIYVLSNERIQL